MCQCRIRYALNILPLNDSALWYFLFLSVAIGVLNAFIQVTLQVGFSLLWFCSH